MGLPKAYAAVLLLLPQLLHAQGQAGASRSSPRPPLSTAAIASQAIPATVTIISVGADGDTLGQGSGFLVRSDGAIVTNWHVMRGAASAVVILASRERYDRVRFLDGNETADIAIIKIPGYDLPTLPVRSTVPAVGERIIAIGSPLGLSQTVSEGIVSATRMVDGRQLIQISAPISPGSSGGAVLDSEGRVFAISTSYLEGGQQLNFAVPVRYALGLLSSNPAPRELRSVFSGSADRTTVVGEAARRPTRARSPVPKLRGVFLEHQTVQVPAADTTFRFMGLIIAGDHVGWETSAPVLPADSLGELSVFHVSSLRTNSSGEVVLDAGGLVQDGYQTDSGGFFLTGSMSTVRGNAHIETRTTPISVKLSNPGGLYDVTCHTEYVLDDGTYTKTVDWDGEMAVALTSDSVHIDLYMTNAAGGASQFRGAAPMDSNGAFALTVAYPGNGASILTGTIRAGLLTGSWEDRRQGGKFVGTLRAERR